MCGFIDRLFAMAATEKALSEKYLLGAGKYVGMRHLHTSPGNSPCILSTVRI